MKRLFLTLAGAVLFVTPLRAETWAQMIVRGIEFPPGEAEKILRTVKIDERYDAMAKAVDEGKAMDVETTMVTTRMGQRSTLFSAREVIYPAEYEPTCVGLFGPEVPRPTPYLFPGDILMTPRMSAFETHNVGLDQEMEVSQSGIAGLLTLRITHEFDTQEADRVILKHEATKGNAQVHFEPVFHDERLNVAFDVPEGQWVLIGMLNSSRKDAPKGSKVVMWVNVETISSSNP